MSDKCDKINIIIHEMTMEQLDEVMLIEEECFPTPWSRASFEKELKENVYAYYFTAELDGKIAGYGGMWHIVNEGHITNIAVTESARRQGVGQKLVDALFAKGRELEMIGMTLEVRISNYKAQRLYSRNGFKPEGIRKNYYDDTREDAVIMWKRFE